MPFDYFVQRANHLGAQHIPFFFLIDFEQQHPIICPLAECAEQGIWFEFPSQNNLPMAAQSSPDKPFRLKKFPIDFATYQQGFEMVQQALQQGNSYLLNLTYATPIAINYNLNTLFSATQAKYKLLFKKEFVCFSPEPFVKISHNQIFTYPMKGTINADLPDAEKQLINSEKEQREHYTIVDLMRNDLAMVGQNVQVTRFRYLEKIITEGGAIWQTSSEIRADLNTNWQAHIGTILSQLLPAGSISGAPKEKTVATIQQAELGQRGYYTGVFGIFNGESLESAVAIRFISQQNGQYSFHSGGGITIQSNAEQEYQELLEKIYVPLKAQKGTN
ncbi:aminodeoxychorismate synthase component I [Avibacterium sp. 20-15]|uniref:aminodeoxychorismate synthase component I n=1 Tax=unclassified Avibacterium TaxID=2685287 RepID=UPI002025F6BB|nr:MULTISPECIES: aminodeoxychorismate synthase component I [unclassified Avibacterium]MCW9732489.1 aminodeoxychorismate synthase component I [Avibacterium sp. 20-15]URL04646.1 aminodeoxychorismate synthase component I [Avibacterium sp. 20-132]